MPAFIPPALTPDVGSPTLASAEVSKPAVIGLLAPLLLTSVSPNSSNFLQLLFAIEKATVNVRKLELEHASLLVESRAQATPLIIEKLAKEKLQMRSATPAVTQYTSAVNITKPQTPLAEVAK